MVEPIDYTSGLTQALTSGARLGGLIGLAQQQQVATEQAQQQQAAARQFQQDWQTAYSSGDPAQLEALAGRYPSQMETIQKAIGFKDDNHRAALGNAARDLRVAVQSGNPQAVAQAAQAHAATLSTVGSSPQEVLQQFQQDPQDLMHTVDAVGMGSLGVKDYYDFQDKAQGRQVTMRGQDLTADTARRSQDITVRGQNISAGNSAADRELKKIELQNQAISNQLNRAKNQAEIDSLNLKLQENQRQKQENLQQKQVSLGYAAEAAQIARGLASDPNLGQVTGSINTWTPVARNSSQDVLNTANRLQSLLTSDNLKLMSGVLTDRDITFLGNISSGLNITDKGIKGSEESIRKRLGAIAERLDSKLQAQGYNPNANSSPQTTPAVSTPVSTAQPASGGFSNLWGD